jgi:hypothetical protein
MPGTPHLRMAERNLESVLRDFRVPREVYLRMGLRK